MKRAIPVSSNLEKRGIARLNCKRCGAYEDELHVFLTCPVAEEVWNITPIALRPSNCVPSIAELIKQGECFTPLPPLGFTSPLWPWVVRNLWKARNKLAFENKAFLAQKICLKSIKDAKEWSDAQVSGVIKGSPVAVTTNLTNVLSFPPPPHAASKRRACMQCRCGLG